MSTEHKYLLDASALINILPAISAEYLETSRDIELYITQLTSFEVGNALWKLYIRGELKSDEVKIIIDLIQELIRYDALRIIHAEDLAEIMDITLRRKITFYDASYIFVAKKFQYVLVTDDNGLRTNAKIEKVKTINSKKLMTSHPEILRI